MKKTSDLRFRSRWDLWTWLIVFVSLAVCMAPLYMDFEIGATIICFLCLAFILGVLGSVRYKIDGNQLKVCILFWTNTYPINKIAEITPTDSMLASPASALTHRIAITFTDRSVTKSSDPLIITPVRQSEFLSQLSAINPAIKISPQLL